MTKANEALQSAEAELGNLRAREESLRQSQQDAEDQAKQHLADADTRKRELDEARRYQSQYVLGREMEQSCTSMLKRSLHQMGRCCCRHIQNISS